MEFSYWAFTLPQLSSPTMCNKSHTDVSPHFGSWKRISYWPMPTTAYRFMPDNQGQIGAILSVFYVQHIDDLWGTWDHLLIPFSRVKAPSWNACPMTLVSLKYLINARFLRPLFVNIILIFSEQFKYSDSTFCIQVKFTKKNSFINEHELQRCLHIIHMIDDYQILLQFDHKK